jgi:protocatechuate 3,4-dioxygenase beta subunit
MDRSGAAGEARPSRSGGIGRRTFIGGAAGAIAVAPAVLRQGWAQSRGRPTPSCGDGAGITAAQTEGPYWKPASPARASLIEPGLPGTRLIIEGVVVDTGCRAIAGTVIDVWQADDAGHYDNAGFRLRGHLSSDDGGRYRLETIVPGVYPGRTRHVHVKVQAPGRAALTTQLYFPGEAANRRDGIFDPDLVMKVRDADGGKIGHFDFVLDLGAAGRRS